MRKGSSPKLTSGARGVRKVRVSRSTAPPWGSTNVGESAVSSSAIAFTVKSRRERSTSIWSPNTTSGLREVSWYASTRCVVIS